MQNSGLINTLMKEVHTAFFLHKYWVWEILRLVKNHELAKFSSKTQAAESYKATKQRVEKQNLILLEQHYPDNLK